MGEIASSANNIDADPHYSTEHCKLTHALIQISRLGGALEKRCGCGGGDWAWLIGCTLWQLGGVGLRCGTSEMPFVDNC